MTLGLPILHTFTKGHRTYRLVPDYYHQTRGFYALDTEEETKAAEDEELSKLESGEWIALGVIVTIPCEGSGALAGKRTHCEACQGSVEDTSLWGIVIANDPTTWENEIPGIVYGDEEGDSK